MTLRLYFHPLSSFCQKVLIALYENDTPFERQIVDLMNEGERSAFRTLWPIGKFPVLRDEARDQLVPETSIIIEYLMRHHPGPVPLIPDDPDLARQTRLRDRLFDLYLNMPMQKVVLDRLRPEGGRDPLGVDEAKTLLGTALGMLDREMETRTWAIGETFTMADCAAAPALFYVDKLMPFSDTHPSVARYRDRLFARPSYARVLEEAQPYLALFPE